VRQARRRFGKPDDGCAVYATQSRELNVGDSCRQRYGMLVWRGVDRPPMTSLLMRLFRAMRGEEHVGGLYSGSA